MLINTEDISSYAHTPDIDNSAYKQVDQVVWYPFTIITTGAMVSYFDHFVEWQCMKGISTGVVEVADICAEYPNGDEISGIDDDAGSIRQYLHDGWRDHGLHFALIGGDEDAVPVRYAYVTFQSLPPFEKPCDYYYAELNSDWDISNLGYYGEWAEQEFDFDPEINVGRLTGTTSAEIGNWFSKLFSYETNPGNGDYSFLFKHLWTLSDEAMDMDLPTGENVLERIYMHWDWWNNFFSDHQIIEEYPGPDEDVRYPKGFHVISAINEGFGWIGLLNHGDHNFVAVATSSPWEDGSWGVYTRDDITWPYPYFYDEDDDGLDDISNSGNMLPILFTTACKSAWYDDCDIPESWLGYPCLAVTEGFTCLNQSGGPAAIGNTR